MDRRLGGWNEIAEREIKRLNNPLPQSERTYFEAGADAALLLQFAREVPDDEEDKVLAD